MAAAVVFGSLLKNVIATGIDGAMYFVTGRQYNPFHIKPIEAAEKLKGKLKCPILIHQCMEDRVLENPDSDTVKLYTALRSGNEDKTYIVLSDDAWHNQLSEQYEQVQASFTKKYISDNISSSRENLELLRRIQPTPVELREQAFMKKS